MTQTMFGLSESGDILRWVLPDPDSEVIPGVKWGYADSVFCAAYWVHQLELSKGNFTRHCFKTGDTLLEETVFCLLGGHGISYELALAAFEHLKISGVITAEDIDVDQIASILSQPLELGDRLVRYRFPNRRAKFIQAAKIAFSEMQPPEDPTALRAWLMGISGIGPKTASFIVRNWMDSDNVAIIDIHLHRAGLLAGVFDARDRVDHDYFNMERKFLTFANALGVRASLLDGLIWAQMREMPLLVDLALDEIASHRIPSETQNKNRPGAQYALISGHS